MHEIENNNSNIVHAVHVSFICQFVRFILCCFVFSSNLSNIYKIYIFVLTGDAVVYGANTATVVIEANDDANGIFSLESVEKSVEEGKTNGF